MVQYKILPIVGENCITREDGERIYELVFPHLDAGESVELDFGGCKIFASLFFNHAIGKLVGAFQPKPEQLNKLLAIVNLGADGRAVLGRVIENAKIYYADPKARDAQDRAIQAQADDEIDAGLEGKGE